LRGSKALGLMS